ncbi:MAG: DUF58 domain-containing protein [Acidobacteriota bacterium]|nr:DUF58 domain-containing protein [Thermoanaerobaculaceae bacterium]
MLEIEEILRKVKHLEIKSRKAVMEKLAGAYHSSFKGRGIELLDVRQYQPGDDFRSIDWNVTARTGELHTKQYFEEREQTIVFAVDVSASMNFGTSKQLKRETIAEAVALLSFSASMNNDRVGLVLFSDEVELYLPPKKKFEHILRLVRELLYFEPKGKNTDFEKSLSQISRLFPRKISLFICSDFLNLSSTKGLKILSKKNDLTIITVEDAAETKLPKTGWMKFYDSETEKWGFVNASSDVVQKRFTTIRKTEIKKFDRQLKTMDIKRIALKTDSEVLPMLERYFSERAAHLR